MSRAFVKEDSDAPPPAPPERAVSKAPNLVTPRGARLIDDEIRRIEAALATGLDAEDEARLRRDLRYWTARRTSAQLRTPDPEARAAGFGGRVTIERGGLVNVVEIVGEDEADPARGRIGWTSPLARALEGAEAGDAVELAAGDRRETVKVLDVGPGGAG